LDIKKARNFIITKKIDLSEFFDGEEAYIVIREPSKTELFDLSNAYEGDDERKAAECIGKLLPDLIVEHNFTENEKPVNNNKKVVDLIDSMTECWQHVYGQISEVLPVTSGEEEENKKK